MNYDTNAVAVQADFLFPQGAIPPSSPKINKNVTHILILSPFYFPEPISTGKYNGAMARCFVEAGATVTVVCSHPLYPGWIPRRSTATQPGVTALRGGLWMRYPSIPLLRRAMLEAWFFYYAFSRSLPLRRKVDRILAVFPPNLFFLATAALFRRNVRRIGIVHDLQGVHASARQKMVTRAILKPIIGVERLSMRLCHRLVVLSEAMAVELIETYDVPPDKIRVCYPFISLHDNASEAKELTAIFPSGRVHLVYSGALGEKQNPEGIIAVIEKVVAKLPQIQVHIFSDGPHFLRMKSKLERLQSPAISFHELVPEKNLAELYRRSDIQIVPQLFGTEHGSMPSKLPNILYSGNAVLGICSHDSELKKMVDRFHAGVCVESWDPDVVCDALSQLISDSAKGAVQARDRNAIRKLFSQEALVASVLEQD